MKLIYSRKDGVCISVKTKSMGSCRCGDCFCNVYPDKTIQYSGVESWQRSERMSAEKANERRPYNSELSTKGFNAVMSEYRRIFKKFGDSVFLTRRGDVKSEYTLYQVRGNSYRIKGGKKGAWSPWSDLEKMPEYLSEFDVAVRFAASVATGEATFTNVKNA